MSPEGKSDRAQDAPRPTCREKKSQLRRKSSLVLNPLSKRQIRRRADPSSPRDAVAGIPAMTSSTYNDTPAQPQPRPDRDHAMGAARRDPRGSEILGADSQVRSCMPPKPGGVVSNTGKRNTQKTQDESLDFRNCGDLYAFFH